MLQAEFTPAYTGITLAGDAEDFNQLYEALHEVVGDEPEYENVRLRVLGLCYDLRHALAGQREFRHVDNGLDDRMKERLNLNQQNLYISFNTYFPEMLFIVAALNDFIKMYAQNVQYVEWSPVLGVVKYFQTTVMECIRKAMSPEMFEKTLYTIKAPFVTFESYFTQYLDLINTRYLAWTAEQRKRNLTNIVTLVVGQESEYQQVKEDILKAAKEYDRAPGELQLQVEYPEEIEW